MQMLQHLAMFLLFLSLSSSTVSATAARKLTFVYLANDVIQNGRKKGGDSISKAFIHVLPEAFKHTTV